MRASRDGFTYRDARREDREEVLAFTAHTWEFGDYIEEVYDRWLSDKAGRFVVVEEAGTERIAAIDKLSFVRQGEAWFEGMRVNPVFRGRGLATGLQRHMIEEARNRGANKVRFLTLIGNTPIHRMSYRDGFRACFVVRDWQGSTEEASATGTSSQEPPASLRRAAEAEAPALLDWWLRSASFATGGLVHHSWQYAGTSPAEWQLAAREGYLFVADDFSGGGAAMPPLLAFVRPNKYREAGTAWTVAALVAPFGETATLMRALKHQARNAGIAEIGGLFADTHELYTGLKATGFEPDPDSERLILFQLDITRC